MAINNRINGCEPSRRYVECVNTAGFTFHESPDNTGECNPEVTDECKKVCCLTKINVDGTLSNFVEHIRCPTGQVVSDIDNDDVPDLITEAACNLYIENLVPGPDTDTTDIEQPETPATGESGEATQTTEPEPPTIFEQQCGNDIVDAYEQCDSSKDTFAEGAIGNCAGHCGAPSSDRPCMCPLTCNQNPLPSSLASVLPVKGKKEIVITWALPQSDCRPNNVFVERCEGEYNPVTPCDWRAVSGSLLTTTFIDTSFEFDKVYSYRVGSYYYDDTNYAETKYSNVLTIEPINEDCVNYNAVNINERFCTNSWASLCNQKNQVQKVLDCSATGNACVAGKCVSQSPCGECAVPFGLFLLPQCQHESCYRGKSNQRQTRSVCFTKPT